MLIQLLSGIFCVHYGSITWTLSRATKGHSTTTVNLRIPLKHIHFFSLAQYSSPILISRFILSSVFKYADKVLPPWILLPQSLTFLISKYRVLEYDFYPNSSILFLKRQVRSRNKWVNSNIHDICGEIEAIISWKTRDTGRFLILRGSWIRHVNGLGGGSTCMSMLIYTYFLNALWLTSSWFPSYFSQIDPNDLEPMRCSHDMITDRVQRSSEPARHSALQSLARLMRHVALWEHECRGEVV